MGEVYRAHDERLGRDVAVKRVLSDQKQDVARERLRREARALAKLQHPAIVPIYDILEEEDGDWLVMELVTGARLDDLLLAGPVAWEQAVDYGLQIAEGLAESHDKGILHRDLKTENVIVTEAGRVRILDFGLAKSVAPESQEAALSESGLVVGTLRAMSPEQARGLQLDERSDLFSLGVLLYELLVGESPFAVATATDTLVRVCTHRQTPVGDRQDVPRELSAFVDRLLSKAPDLRPGSASEVVVTLSGIRASQVRAGSASDDLQRSVGERTDAAHQEATRELSPVAIAAHSNPAAPGDAEPPERSPGHFRRYLALGLSATLALGLAGLGYLAATDSTSPAGSSSSRAAAGAPTPAANAQRPASAPLSPYELLERGRARLLRYDRKGAIDEAIDIFERLSARDAESAVAFAGLAHAYWRKHDDQGRERMWLDRARTAARKALALDEHLAWAHLAQARVERSAGETGAAHRSLDRVMQLEPGSAHGRMERARLHRSAGVLDRAEASFREAWARAPKDREIIDELGALVYSQGRLREAEALFRKSVEAVPDCSYGHRNLSAVLMAQERFDEAARALQDALEIQPHASLYGNLGAMYFFQGMYRQAATAYERALELSGSAQTPNRWADLAEAYRQIPGRAADAREAHAVAIRLVRDQLADRPDDTALLSRLALYLARDGQSGACQAVLERLASHADKLDAIAHFRMAVAHEIGGRRPAALTHVRQALSAGYPVSALERDPDLASLRTTPAYQRLLVRPDNGSAP